MKVRQFLGLLALAAACPWALHAQMDAREEIVVFTEKLRQQPGNADWHLQRGDLYRSIENWDAAQSDYDQARALNPKIDTIDFLRGRLFLEANWPLSAKIALDRFLTNHSTHVEALIARARAHAKLTNYAAASRDYSRALQLTPQPQPELYLERAQILAAGGDAKDALQALDEGIKRLGPLVTLQLGAIEIEMSRKNYDGALARVDAVAAASPRKETWLARKGEILREAGRPAEARAAFEGALQSIETLPPARRNVPAMAALEKRVREQYEAVK